MMLFLNQLSVIWLLKNFVYDYNYLNKEIWIHYFLTIKYSNKKKNYKMQIEIKITNMVKQIN